MDKDFLKGIKQGLGFIFIVSLFFGIVFAVGFHSADEITSGSFIGSFNFSSAIVTGLPSTGIAKSDSSICNVSYEGDLRYNPTNMLLEICDGIDWGYIEDSNGIGTFTDARDGKTYDFERMPDGKYWMTQSLAYEKDSCLSNAMTTTSTDSCIDGTVTGIGTVRVYKPAVTQGICPSGWHLPKLSELENLKSILGGSYSTVEAKLNIHGGFWTWGAANPSGFFNEASNSMSLTDEAGNVDDYYLNGIIYPLDLGGIQVRCIKD